MSEEGIGHAVKRATEFLAAFHEDVAALIETIDGKLAERGWFPKERNRISYDLGNALSSRYWVIHHIARLYLLDLQKASTCAIALGIHLAPSAFDNAVCFVAVGRFPDGKANESIWNEWLESAPLLSAIARSVGPVTIDGEAREGIFPAAIACKGFAVSLDKLNSGDALDEWVVSPALELATEVGA